MILRRMNDFLFKYITRKVYQIAPHNPKRNISCEFDASVANFCLEGNEVTVSLNREKCRDL